MRLILENGTAIEGRSFGAPVSASGEVVFNTGMVGYVESLTDPSYAGQILVLTYPLIGNYGVPSRDFFESSKIQVNGLIVSEYGSAYSHHAAKESLGAWLTREGVPALEGVDTRALTKMLRERGVMLGQLVERGQGAKKFYDPNVENLVAKVSIRAPRVKAPEDMRPRIVLVDCGAKENIERELLRLGATVIRVPWDYDWSREDHDGVVVSNGPGDPTQCVPTVLNLKKAIRKRTPILGVCLGNQLLALAAGARTYKLKFGHRGHNQPCMDMIGRPAFAKATAGKCYVTSQNHGFAVDGKTLPRGWEPWFTNLNDSSIEGIRHESGLWRAVQFHPEASPGPTDTAWIFEEFINTLAPPRQRHSHILKNVRMSSHRESR